MQQRFQWMLVATISLAGCAGQIDNTGDDDGSGSDEPVVCEQPRTYTGFGGADLAANRPQIEPGSDRLRLKPYGALSAEYRAALGLTAFDTAAYAATFGRPPARWFQEPAAVRTRSTRPSRSRSTRARNRPPPMRAMRPHPMPHRPTSTVASTRASRGIAKPPTPKQRRA
jgi:hypothetical protein